MLPNVMILLAVPMLFLDINASYDGWISYINYLEKKRHGKLASFFTKY